MGRLEQIQAFVLVCEKESISAAANELNVSGAAVSKQLSRLEAELGIQLLNRTTRSVKLTEIGISYKDQCLRILEEAAIADSWAMQVTAAPQGKLHVVTGRYFSRTFILPRLTDFLSQYPLIEFNLELAERIPNMEEENIDLLFGVSFSAPDNAVQKCIGTTRYCYCASKKYLKTYGTPKKPSDLLQHRYITHSKRNPNDTLTFSAGEKITLKPYLLVNDAETMIRIAKEGLGIIKLHHYVVKEALDRGELIEILPGFVEKEIPLYVAYLQKKYLPSKVRCFIDFFTPLSK